MYDRRLSRDRKSSMGDRAVPGALSRHAGLRGAAGGDREGRPAAAAVPRVHHVRRRPSTREDDVPGRSSSSTIPQRDRGIGGRGLWSAWRCAGPGRACSRVVAENEAVPACTSYCVKLARVHAGCACRHHSYRLPLMLYFCVRRCSQDCECIF